MISLLLATFLYSATMVSGLPRQDGAETRSQFHLAQFGGPQKPSDEEREKARLRLGITREQQAQIEALYVESGKQMRDVGGKMRDLYKQLENLYDAYDFDRQQARSIRRQITGLHRRTLEIHADVQEKLRGILNREQLEKMSAIRREERERWQRDRERRRPSNR